MFESGGTAYLYFTYGMHWCFNVASGRAGEAGAVLVRALEPVEGLEVMERRRGRPSPLTSGPARICQALGLDGSLDGHPLDRPPLWLEEDGPISDDRIAVSGRVGIREARRWPLRFFVRDHPDVSTASADPPDPGSVPEALRWILEPPIPESE